MDSIVPIFSPFRYRSFHIDKDHPLGQGSYGAVFKANCDQLPCAAKILHPTILDPHDPGSSKIMQRFQQECSFLENIRHPHIVQYLGMTMDPESSLPVLLMELLDESLTKMLECSQKPLPYFVQVDICHDIALAVAYLHANDIIHRDLSSNNVLIMAKRRAKITDFGMSRLSKAAPSMTPFTVCPGTLAYMPPEALDEPPRYTKKLDCFSEGVLLIQVCTHQWPDPGPRTKTVCDSRSPTGMMQMPVLEPERRKSHIDMIDHGHAMLPLAMDCLQYQEKERPSSVEVCQKLGSLKDSEEYRESLQEIDSMVQKDVRELASENVQQLQIEIQSKERQIKEQERQIIELNRLLEGQELIQQTDHSLHRQVEQLQHQFCQQCRQKLTSLPQMSPSTAHQPETCLKGIKLQQDHAKQPQSHTCLYQDLAHVELDHQPKRNNIFSEWRDGGNTPFEMARGDVVVDGDVAYFMGFDGRMCSYNSSTRKWCELPMRPYWYCSLAVVNGLLTAIGGKTGNNSENKLLSIKNNKEKHWVEHFPPMLTKRHNTAAMTTKQHLIVVGGENSMSNLDVVEVMAIETLVWSSVASLPHPYSQALATVCGDHLYMLGGWSNGGRTKSMLACSLKKLLHSHSETLSDSVWCRVADTPQYLSSSTAVNGELVAVGGEGADYKSTTSVYQYKQTADSWNLITNMPTARYRSLVAVLSTNEIIVVGGYAISSIIDKVEFVNLK